MTMPWRHRLRLLRRGVAYTLAGLLVLLALGNGIGSQLLPLAERHPDRIAEWLSARAQRPVAFDHVATEWTRRGPLLRLDNLRVGDAANPLRIGDAEILVAQYAGVLPGRSFTELRLRGLDLTLQRDANGRWSVRGLPGQQQAAGDPFEALERLGELQVSHARLRVLAPELGIDLQVPRIDLRLRVDGPRIHGGASAWIREGAAPFTLAGDLDRRNGNGNVYAGSRKADLSELSGKVALLGVGVQAGQGRAEAWGRLDGNRIVAMHALASLQDVVLRGAPLAPGEPAPRHLLGVLALDARWSGTVRQWQAKATRLRIGGDDHAQILDGLALQGGQRYAASAARIDAGPLAAVLALSDAVPPALRRWLGQTAAGAVLEDVRIVGERGGRLQAAARVDGFRFDPVGHAPGMRGVSGWLQGDERGLRFRFDPAAQVAFDWPAGFGVVHEFKADGEAVLWRDDAGWTVRTPGLSIDGGQLQASARGGIGFQDDGSHPRLDLAADIGDAPIAMAHGFWIHHLMPKGTVAWLDAALRGGTLRNVHAVVAGDLDDWPFRNEPGKAGAGVFRADAHIDNGLVKFQPDWPAAERVDADVSFVADGFSVDGRARLGGVQATSLKGGIARFGTAELKIDADTAGDARDYLALLAASPLHKTYGETMDNLRAAGPARADFHMVLPLHHARPVPPSVRGTVELEGASLREERWKLAFEQVRGRARYDEGGFDADALQVRHEGTPGVLSLRAGPHVRDPAQAFEAELQAQADIDGLLDKAGNLDWLKPHLRGSSTWTVDVGIPRGAGRDAGPSRLRLRSSLAGTAIDLPEPLRKPAAQPLPATVDVTLPIERGEVEVTLGGLLSLRSRSGSDKTGIGIRLGGGRADAPPSEGLAVGGRVQRLDALDWIAVVAGDRGGASLPLRRIEVQAEQLRLLGSSFADARLLVVPAPRGTAVQVQGTGLAGSLLVPDQDGATVAGRFDRLHWTPPPKAGGASAPVASDASPFDPANIPPLLFEVGDLRLGNAVLGQARFRSTPVAGGLRMDEFSTRGGKQRLSANGTWTGRGVAARTQLDLDVDSDDIGALLAGLSLGGQVGGGKGKLAVDASWRGGPEAVAPATMEATLRLDARDGRLLEIEPGAGRVLGLLGIGQLPRRLTLDFRDFFDKGFAFDSIKGDVRLSGGYARTDDITIKGPAADIHMRGSADVRNQRFDQTVDVLPKSGGLLTAVGAIAGGPVGAAVGAMANAVLDKPMQEIGARTYRITGPWQSPKVEVVQRNAATPRAAAEREPPG